MSDIEAAARALLDLVEHEPNGHDSGPNAHRVGATRADRAECRKCAAIDALRSALAHATRGGCPKCGSHDHRVRYCGNPEHATVHPVDSTQHESRCTYCDNRTWHATTPTPTTEGSHPNGPVENCPCHLCRFAFADTPPPATGEGFAGLPVAYQSSSIGAPPWDGPATGEAEPDPRGEDREAVEAAQSVEGDFLPDYLEHALVMLASHGSEADRGDVFLNARNAVRQYAAERGEGGK